MVEASAAIRVAAAIRAGSETRAAVRVFPAEATVAEAVITMAADRILTVDGASVAAIILAGEASTVAEVLKGIAAEASSGTAVFETETIASAFTAAAGTTTARRTHTAIIPAIAIRPDITIDGAIGVITPVAT